MAKKNGSQISDELRKATDISRTIQESGIEIKDCFDIPKAEDDALIKHAKECGKWLPSYKLMYGLQCDAKGVESEVYLHHNGIDAIKINSGYYHKTWFDFFMRITAHNIYFPDTAYDIEGYTYRLGKLGIILRQPKIDIIKSADPADVKSDLEQQGFIFKSIYDVRDVQNGIILRDFHHENAVVDGNGDIVYIDPLIQFTNGYKLPQIIEII